MEISTPCHADNILSLTSTSEVLLSDEPQVENAGSAKLLKDYPIQCATDLLLLLSANDRTFDSVSPINCSEQSSQISIPFSDVILDEGVRKAAVEDRTLGDDEDMTFSSEFKKALSESRNPEKETLGDGYISPVAAVIEEKSERILKTEQLVVARNSQQRPIPTNLLSEKLESIARSLDEFRVRIPSEEESDSCGEQKDDEDEKEGSVKKMATKMKPRNIPAVTKPVDINMDYCDTNSGLWRMLSAYDDLVLSQPGYNTFRQDVKHWLESDTVPWEIMEESSRKCLEWLEKHYKQQVSA